MLIKAERKKTKAMQKLILKMTAEKADHYKGAVKSDDAEIETDKKEIQSFR